MIFVHLFWTSRPVVTHSILYTFIEYFISFGLIEIFKYKTDIRDMYSNEVIAHFSNA